MEHADLALTESAGEGALPLEDPLGREWLVDVNMLLQGAAEVAIQGGRLRPDRSAVKGCMREHASSGARLTSFPSPESPPHLPPQAESHVHLLSSPTSPQERPGPQQRPYTTKPTRPRLH